MKIFDTKTETVGIADIAPGDTFRAYGKLFMRLDWEDLPEDVEEGSQEYLVRDQLSQYSAVRLDTGQVVFFQEHNNLTPTPKAYITVE